MGFTIWVVDFPMKPRTFPAPNFGNFGPKYGPNTAAEGIWSTSHSAPVKIRICPSESWTKQKKGSGTNRFQHWISLGHFKGEHGWTIISGEASQ